MKRTYAITTVASERAAFQDISALAQGAGITSFVYTTFGPMYNHPSFYVGAASAQPVICIKPDLSETTRNAWQWTIASAHYGNDSELCETMRGTTGETSSILYEDSGHGVVGYNDLTMPYHTQVTQLEFDPESDARGVLIKITLTSGYVGAVLMPCTVPQALKDPEHPASLILSSGLVVYHTDQKLETTYPQGVYSAWLNFPNTPNDEGSRFGHSEWGSRVMYLAGNGTSPWTGDVVGSRDDDGNVINWTETMWTRLRAFNAGTSPYLLPIVIDGVSGTKIISDAWYDPTANDAYSQRMPNYVFTNSGDVPTGNTEDPDPLIIKQGGATYLDGRLANPDDVTVVTDSPITSSTGRSAPIDAGTQEGIPTLWVLVALGAAIIAGVLF